MTYTPPSLTAAILPAFAGSGDSLFAQSQGGVGSGLAMIATFIVLAGVLTRVWLGIANHAALHHEPLNETEGRKKKPYLPSLHTIIVTVACTGGLFLLSLKTVGGIAPFNGSGGISAAASLFAFGGILSMAAQLKWPRTKRYVFAFTVGTVATFILLGFYYMLFDPNVEQDPFFMALGIVCVILAWRFLFGGWSPHVKASVLGTFIFWLGVHLLFTEEPTERGAHLLAIFVAFIPALIWCKMFLKEHRQRISLVILMFFSGMLSTAPILFYDAMVRHKVELQFFLFRIVPENFTHSSNAFVTGNLVGVTGMRSTLIATLISFMLVGLIEEVSKFWVLKKSGQQFFSSIDDVLQLGIIVAIGFAFAENVMNPTYFLAFVRQYILNPEAPQWGAFVGNVLGRAILTNMVHILSTGVLAYFYGLALFADPILDEQHKAGKVHLVARTLHRVLRQPEKTFYRAQKLCTGFAASVLLHGLFNFLVTLPDLLPGNPRTLGDLVGAGPNSPLHFFALLIIPSLFYVVGGFWVLSILFYKKENMKERGVLVEIDTFVPQRTFYQGLGVRS